MATPKEIVEEARALAVRLFDLQHAYYVLNQPKVSDQEYDRLFDRLLEIERDFPDLVSDQSPTSRVGSDLSAEFPEYSHTIPVLSLDKAYTQEELEAWIAKLAVQGAESFVVEEKLDGSSLVLYYREGRLDRAVTRGNGEVGNDITANVRTIKSVPLVLPEPRTGPVRGEVFLPKSDFAKINQDTTYANPRNFASGTLRRVKSKDVAKVPLKIFIYEGFFEGAPDSHWQNIEELKALGFPVNPRTRLLSGSQLASELAAFVAEETRIRPELDYEIDGLVLKVDDIPLRNRLGYTGHHPRWALAYKFESPQGLSRVLAIDVQIGRTGRATPVARIEPVSVGGSTISNVTLHNQDYIDSLELSVGDSVAVSRRGDVIPAIERVIDKAENAPPVWQLPPNCPVCGTALEKQGAHHFCTNFDCPDRLLGRLRFFVGRDQMDIEGLGEETVELLHDAGYLNDIPDIYRLPYERLQDLQGWGPKKTALLQKGVQASLSRPYRVVLPSIGIQDLGPKVAELLIQAGYLDVDDIFALVDSGRGEALRDIKGLGDKTIARILATFEDPAFRSLVKTLRDFGLQFRAEAPAPASEEGPFSGQAWCVTGSFETFKPRDRAMDHVKAGGGTVVSDVSSKTTHLLAGSGAGSKLKKAESLGIQVVSESEFLELIGRTEP